MKKSRSLIKVSALFLLVSLLIYSRASANPTRQESLKKESAIIEEILADIKARDFIAAEQKSVLSAKERLDKGNTDAAYRLWILAARSAWCARQDERAWEHWKRTPCEPSADLTEPSTPTDSVSNVCLKFGRNLVGTCRPGEEFQEFIRKKNDKPAKEERAAVNLQSFEEFQTYINEGNFTAAEQKAVLFANKALDETKADVAYRFWILAARFAWCARQDERAREHWKRTPCEPSTDLTEPSTPTDSASNVCLRFGRNLVGTCRPGEEFQEFIRKKNDKPAKEERAAVNLQSFATQSTVPAATAETKPWFSRNAVWLGIGTATVVAGAIITGVLLSLKPWESGSPENKGGGPYMPSSLNTLSGRPIGVMFLAGRLTW